MQLNRIEYALSRNRRKRLKETLKTANETMRELATDSISLMPVRRRARNAADFKQIRDFADAMYDAFEVTPWCCSPAHCHNASLRLDRRPRMGEAPSDCIAAGIRFRVLFSEEDRCVSWSHRFVCKARALCWMAYHDRVGASFLGRTWLRRRLCPPDNTTQLVNQGSVFADL